MRALFREFSANLQDGSYIFVAKAAIVTADYQNIQNDFKKILSRSKTLA